MRYLGKQGTFSDKAGLLQWGFRPSLSLKRDREGDGVISFSIFSMYQAQGLIKNMPPTFLEFAF